MNYDYGSYVDKEGNKIPAYCIIESGSDGATFNDPNNGLYAYWTIDAEGCNNKEWYKENPTEGQPSINLSGKISNVAHFESSCITYTGDNSKSSADPEWNEENTCKLVPDGIEGIKITDSSNGRGSDNSLVLRFSAKITFNPEVYKFTNTHMLAIAPSGRRNVTDSYVQVQAMFGERAADCAKDDATCNTTTNEGENNG